MSLIASPRRASLAIATLVSLAAALPAHAFLASNMLRVKGDENAFAVDYRPGSWMPDYWCAAGDFATRHLNVVPTTRIYMTSTAEPRRTGKVTFSLHPAESAGDARVNKLGKDDGSLTADFALHYCQSRRHIFGED